MAARNMFIEIYEYPYKFMTFARMLGRPHGGAPTGLCRNSQKINSFKNRVLLCQIGLTIYPEQQSRLVSFVKNK